MAWVGEMFAAAAVKEIVGRLTQSVVDEIILQWGYKDELVKMVEKMKDFEAVMQDAEDNLRRGGEIGHGVERWLMKLKSVAYDIEDVLDDLDTPTSQAKCYKPIPRLTGPHKLDDVKKKIDVLESEQLLFKLEARRARPEGSRNRKSFAATNKTGMVGRKTERDKIIKLLFNSKADEDISVIPIVGPGGIGKTTLAASVYTDESVKAFFHILAWVDVSKEFDLKNIGFTIMKFLGSGIRLEDCDILQILHDTLKAELATTRYLIVLDDLCEEDGQNLEELKGMLQYGSKGSKIIVTTRNESVVKKLGVGTLANEKKICTVPRAAQIVLDILGPEHCWEVMKQRALGPHDNGRSDLEEIGFQIAQKCGGLPLVLSSLGQVMSESRDVMIWENIRDTKFDLTMGDAYQQKIMKCLMPIYYYMKLDFKMCFTYLAVFPKGFVMNTDRLIQQWDALGYIPPGYDGKICIDYLLGISFLQISGATSVRPISMHVEAPREVTMHDLMHELASFITTDEFLVLDAEATLPRNWNRAVHCRHTQLINYMKQSRVFKDLPGRLRSLHFRNSQNLQLPKNAFSRSAYLRILDLSSPQNTGASVSLPSSMRKLKLLRYFDATGFPIRSLPKSFSKLQNIETLILSNCTLETLPANIHSLYKLCYMDLAKNRSLNKIPNSFCKLSKLSFLNLSGCYILKELPKSIYQLTFLQHLDMSECRAIQDLPDKFGSLSNLLFLSLSGCSKLTKLPDSVSLKSLEHLDLSSCHELENLPKDFGNLQNLAFLNLSGCCKISVLPESFCQLIHLKYLDLSDCHDLKELPDCFGDLAELDSLNLTSCSKLQILPESLGQLLKLRHLDFSYCVRLKLLPSSLGKLSLHTLDITCALALKDLPDGLDTMSSLTHFEFTKLVRTVLDKAKNIEEKLNLNLRTIMHIVRPIEKKRYSNIVELAQLTCRELDIARLHNVSNPEDGERVKLRDKSDLQMLTLTWGIWDDELSDLGLEELNAYIKWREDCKQSEQDKALLERLVPPRNLEHFLIYGYMSKNFPSWLSNISFFLPSLTVLSVCDLQECDTLPPFGRLPNLRSLYLAHCPKITKVGKEFYGDSGSCTKLRLLHVKSMENLVEWWTTKSVRGNEEFLIPNLHSLTLEDCPKLKFLPYPPRSMILHLENSDEVFPESGFGKLSSSSTLPFQMVIKNCNFSSDKWQALQHLPTLETFQVESCSGLRAVPEVVRCFTSLTALFLTSLKQLEALPEWLGQLSSLEHISIEDCPIVKTLPDSMKNLVTLRVVCFENCNGLDILPEWLGQLTSIQEFNIIRCPNMTYLPQSIQNLIELKKLYIWGCPRLVERCQQEDANLISHIPKVTLHG